MVSKIDIDKILIEEIIKFKDSPIPTCNTYRPWISYSSKIFKGFKSNENTGKWCIFAAGSTINKKWDLIKSLIDSGEIVHAKVSTNLFLPKSRSKKYVICVYTKDWNDLKDLNKTRESLRSVGFNRPLKYKRDIDTMNNVKGSKEFYLKI